jgi:hypothetical protein
MKLEQYIICGDLNVNFLLDTNFKSNYHYFLNLKIYFIL